MILQEKDLKNTQIGKFSWDYSENQIDKQSNFHAFYQVIYQVTDRVFGIQLGQKIGGINYNIHLKTKIKIKNYGSS